MSEQVYRTVQIGVETVPGTAVPATVSLPIDESTIALDRSTQYPNEDYGRNARNHATSGYHGLRGAQMSFAADVRFEDIMRFLEMHFAGGVVPSGAGPYVWTYPLEAGASTLKTYTVQEGVVGSTQDEWRMVGTLIDDMTLEYDALAAPGAQPWRVSGTMMGFGKDLSAMTAAITPPATLETAMGHLTVLKEGAVETAFASLGALSGSLIRASVNTTRNLVRRAYGAAAGDVASGWGYSERTGGTFELMVKIGATSKTDVYDAWNVAGGSITEKRIRVEAVGTSPKKFQLDFRAGYTDVGIDNRDGERVFLAKGELVDDGTLNAPLTAIVTNSAANLIEAG